MYRQSEIIFDPPAGKQLAEAGISLAVDTANAEHPGWSTRCWQLFWHWLNRKPRYYRFTMEDFRAYLYDFYLIEKPRTDRAFGFIPAKAQKAGLIEFGGYDKAKNKKAHTRPVNVWIKK